MTTKTHDIAVFLGRFSPFHKGHLTVVERALERADFLLIGIGSADTARNTRNPFTYDDRVRIVQSGLTVDQRSRTKFFPVHDYTYNDDKWLAQVQASVRMKSQTFYGHENGPYPDRTILLIGHFKDPSSFYLSRFPQWDYLDIRPVHMMNSTDIREWMFYNHGAEHANPYAWWISDEHYNKVKSYTQSPEVHALNDEYDAVASVKRKWENSPYPPMFVTADALVTQAAHVLLVKRAKGVGKGLLALPGGHLDPLEGLMECALRELKEETDIDLAPAIIRGAFVRSKVFDNPWRSARGRYITECFHFALNPGYALPKVKVTDPSEVEEVFWMPLADVLRNRDKFFEDHIHVIETMLGV